MQLASSQDAGAERIREPDRAQRAQRASTKQSVGNLIFARPAKWHSTALQNYHVAAVFAGDRGEMMLNHGLDPTDGSVQAHLWRGQPFLMTR